MTKKNIAPNIGLDPNPKAAKFKALGGAEHDEWNQWLASRTSMALPMDDTQAARAVISGMVDLKPADPIEGIIISQLMAANQASLEISTVGTARCWFSSPPTIRLAQENDASARARSHSAMPCGTRLVLICTMPKTKWAKACSGTSDKRSQRHEFAIEPCRLRAPA